MKVVKFLGLLLVTACLSACGDGDTKTKIPDKAPGVPGGFSGAPEGGTKPAGKGAAQPGGPGGSSAAPGGPQN